VVGYLAGRGERHLEIDDLAGLAERQPVTAALMSIFLLSLIGVPLTGGFFGKFYVFRAALDVGLGWLTVLGLLNSAVAAYYYLRILVVMYMREAPAAAEGLPQQGLALRVAVGACAAGTLVLGIFPSVILGFVNAAAGAR
jgi:NADH-quinone oxidoreductase subunit N